MRALVLSGLALLLVTGAAAPSCGPRSTSTNDPCSPSDAKKAPDAGSVSANQKCWPTSYPPPLTGQAAVSHSSRNRPGTIHVVIVAVDVVDADTRRVNQPCFAVAVALAGKAPAINTETGMPYLDKEGITTPDVIKYELGAGITTLNVSVSSLARAGLSLRLDVQLDGHPYGQPSFAWNPAQMAGQTRMLSAHVTVEIPT